MGYVDWHGTGPSEDSYVTPAESQAGSSSLVFLLIPVLDDKLEPAQYKRVR